MKKNIEIEKYCEAYVDYLSKAKTERLAYSEAVRLIEKLGFKPIEKMKTLKAGDRVYRGYHGKTLFTAIVGKNGTAAGLRIVGGHTDAPRLDLKPKPIYEKGYLVYFDTHMYGGIKKYQWLTIPLALYGTVVKKDGTKIDIAVGDNADDPVFMISDILPHFGKEQLEKKAKDVVAAEDMDVIAGMEADELVKFLEKKYDITKDDLLSSELEIVPAGMPRDVGFDRSLITAYGHDDRVCAYAGLHALCEIAKSKTVPSYTAAVVLCDKEEIGSVGATGMESSFFENTVAELMDREAKNVRDIDVRRALEKSQMLSADVCHASDPHYPKADSTGNESHLGKGPCVIKYTGAASKGGASDASAEFIAHIRKIMDDANVVWQMGELGRAEEGGGGTISKCMARFGMDVVDFGVPLLNMHAPWEIASKHDCYYTKEAYAAFMKN